MRETDLDAVDEAIPSTLQYSEVVAVRWVGEYVLDAGHRRVEERAGRICMLCDRVRNHMRNDPGLDFVLVSGRVGRRRLGLGNDCRIGLLLSKMLPDVIQLSEQL